MIGNIVNPKSKNNLTEIIISMARESGADLVGITSPEIFLHPGYKGMNPQDVFKRCSLSFS